MLFIVAGILCGIIGFLPLYAAIRKVTPATQASLALIGIASIVFSFAFLFISIVVVYKVAPEHVLPFFVAVVAAFLVCIVVCAVWVRRRNSR